MTTSTMIMDNTTDCDGNAQFSAASTAVDETPII